MMGRRHQRQGQFFYVFDLDKVVPPDHLVRQIDGLLDLSWVHKELASYYSHTRNKRKLRRSGEGIRKRNEHQPHAQGSRRTPMRRQIKTDRTALSCACGARLEGLPDARRPRWCAGGETQRELSARGAIEGNDRTVETNQIAALMSAFAVAIGGKADMPCCGAYVCF
jgi:hypothetical protein